MESPSTSEAALKLEIARLSGAINRHKSGTSTPTSATGYPASRPRNNVYVNPNYKPPANKYTRPVTTSVINRPQSATSTTAPQPAPGIASQAREIVLGGVAFESSGRSLVRKDLPKSASAPANAAPLRPPSSHAKFSRTNAGHLIPNSRAYKPKTSSRGRRGGPVNMTLNNSRRPYQSRRQASKRLKYSDKPCPRFTTTGACSRGLTCMYQHDAAKIAICWNFLQGNCPNTVDTCNLSHDPTPERTPLCMHFANNGRCTRENCPFPHVRVGARQGVCRDFAVLGYCAKGLDCDKQHVRECPDFAEKGTCSTKGCKLPHVIRANRNRKPASTTMPETTPASSASTVDSSASAGTNDVSSLQHASAEDAQLGDEYISLTFHESEDDSESEEEDEEESENEEEGADPTDSDDLKTEDQK